MRLAAIDTAGLSDQDKISRDLLLRQFAEDQEAAEYKEWEMPVNQMGGIYTTYPQLVAQLSFTSVKDYDDWIARLHQIPKAFDQVTANMAIGVEDHRVPPKYLLEKVLDRVKQMAAQKPEDSPLALPLKKFPASIKPAEQERIKKDTLDAIAHDVLPAYLRFARFLEVSYVPAGRAEPGIGSLPDGAKYYQFLHPAAPPPPTSPPSRSTRSASTKSSATKPKCWPSRKSWASKTSPPSAPASSPTPS
jgi:uncharacterized protein (DUF885 family)